MADGSPSYDPERIVSTLVAQLERDRRAFLGGNAVYVAGNLILAGAVWGREGSGPLVWLPAATAFLGNVFYALTAEWELRWESLWRREIPRLERSLGDVTLFETRPAAIGSRGLGRALKWLSWLLSAVWLLVLLILIDRSGLIG